MFPQSVWGGHFSHVHTEYVHPFSSQKALRLCHVSPHPTRLGGGASSSVLLDFIDTFIAKFKPNLLNVAQLKVSTVVVIMTDHLTKLIYSTYVDSTETHVYLYLFTQVDYSE